MTVSQPTSMFDQIVEASGISALFAAGALRRALVRAGIDPDRMTRADLTRALPAIEQTLRVFLAADEVPRRLAVISRLGQ